MQADGVIVLDFEKMHDLCAEDFLDGVFTSNVPEVISVGNDVRFGDRAAGDISTMQKWASEHGMKVHGFDLLKVDGGPVTSTRIRSLLKDGLIKEANELLGHPYTLVGSVVHGRGEGAQMGFRTANIEVQSDMFLLKRVCMRLVRMLMASIGRLLSLSESHRRFRIGRALTSRCISSILRAIYTMIPSRSRS